MLQVPESEITPESVLPAQLYEPPLGGARLQPEKRLQLAVLADAVLEFHRWAGVERTRGRRLFAEVEDWFASDDTDGPFAFVAICHALQLDPDYIRRGLGRWLTSMGAPATPRLAFRRDGSGTRHQVVQPRLRRVA
jgi:hypothetical protein